LAIRELAYPRVVQLPYKRRPEKLLLGAILSYVVLTAVEILLGGRTGA